MAVDRAAAAAGAPVAAVAAVAQHLVMMAEGAALAVRQKQQAAEGAPAGRVEKGPEEVMEQDQPEQDQVKSDQLER